ncbi:MAG: DUF2092 domain-containing protein, partial [Candidatus Aminicenantes bacterium]|nr:DUF2092 domain-containing protein [Candidatus Aminicenantes bacterium]
MKKITYLILTLFLMIFFSIGEVTASKQTRGEKILRKMVDKYKNIDIYKDETSIRFETKIKDKQFPETIYSCLIQRPNKISLNLKSGVLGFTLISNGKKLWLYFPQGKEYADQMAPADLEGIFSKISLNQKFLMGEIVLFHLFSPQPYEAITAGFKQIELLGESVINGNKTFHVLLKGDLKTERHLWIDTWSYLLRKVSTDFSQSIEILRKAGLDIGNNSSIKFFET